MSSLTWAGHFIHFTNRQRFGRTSLNCTLRWEPAKSAMPNTHTGIACSHTPAQRARLYCQVKIMSRLIIAYRPIAIVVLCFLVLPACARLPWYEKREVEMSPETVRALRRFEEADRLLKNRSYQAALTIYADYLEEHPEGPLRDRAWMKTGTIYMALEAYSQAQEAFRRLLSDHPTSSFIPQAGYQLTLAHYRAGEYESAVTQGKSALNLAENDTQRLRIQDLLGNIYRASGKFSNAIMSYIQAYRLAPPGKQPEILTNMKETIPSVETADLESFVETFRKTPPGGYLHFYLAQRYADEGRIETALDVLSNFFKFFPNHEKLENALAFREELKSRALVDRFLIGCILPLSGAYAAFGERALTGIELALNLFNAQVHTHPVQLAVKDSKGDPKEAVAALKALALNEGVIGIIGPMITSESVALEAQALKIPVVTLTQKAQIPALGDYVFRNFLTPLSQVETIVSYSVKDLGLDRFAILYPDEPYGISFMNSFWDALIRHGAQVVGIESYTPEQTDFNEQIRKLVGLYYPRPEPEERAWSDGEVALWNTLLHLRWPPAQTTELETPDNPDEATVFEQEPPRDEDAEPDPIVDFQAVFIPDSYGKVALITPQLLYHGVEGVLLLGCNLWHSPELIRMAHEYVQDAVISEGFFAQSPLPRVVNFVNNYKRIFGSTPGYLEAQAYDTAWILCQATNTPKVNSRISLKRTLTGLADFPGVTGITSFDESGEINRDTYLLKIQGRQFIQIRP